MDLVTFRSIALTTALEAVEEKEDSRSKTPPIPISRSQTPIERRIEAALWVGFPPLMNQVTEELNKSYLQRDYGDETFNDLIIRIANLFKTIQTAHALQNPRKELEQVSDQIDTVMQEVAENQSRLEEQNGNRRLIKMHNTVVDKLDSCQKLLKPVLMALWGQP